MGESVADIKARMRELSCVVVIPTYNNEKTILSVIKDVLRYTEDVIVVNDGSTDSTAALLAELKDVDVIHLKENKEIGRAHV